MEQKNAVQIKGEIAEIEKKLQSVQAEIEAKKEEVGRLKISNAKLIEMNLGKQRLPKSLSIQRDQISKLNLHIEELEFVKESLEKQIEEKKKDLYFARLAEEVLGFKESNQNYFQIFGKVEQALHAFNVKVSELFNQMREGVHPLSRLRDLALELNRNKINLDIFDLDLRSLISRYVSTINQLAEVDELKDAVGEIKHQTMSYSNQANATIRGAKAYPKPLTRKASEPLTEHERRISFFQQACRADDLKTGKGGFEPTILEPVKYVQDKAVRIPGTETNVPDHPPPDFAQNEFEKEQGLPDDPAISKARSDEIIEKEIKKVNQ